MTALNKDEIIEQIRSLNDTSLVLMNLAALAHMHKSLEDRTHINVADVVCNADKALTLFAVMVERDAFRGSSDLIDKELIDTIKQVVEEAEADIKHINEHLGSLKRHVVSFEDKLRGK